MVSAVWKEGPCAPLFFAALVALAAPVGAQTVDLAALEACAARSTDSGKLACFEALLADARGAAERTAANASPPGETAGASVTAAAGPDAAAIATTASAEPASATPVAAGTTVASPALAGPAVSATPATATAVTPAATAAVMADTAPEPAPVAPEPVPDTVAAASAPAPMPAAEVGREQLENDREEDSESDAITLTVERVSKGNSGSLYFYMDNGQVWRQNEPRHLQYPRQGAFDVTVTRGMMGEYRLRIGDNGRLVRIRRVK